MVMRRCGFVQGRRSCIWRCPALLHRVQITETMVIPSWDPHMQGRKIQVSSQVWRVWKVIAIALFLIGLAWVDMEREYLEPISTYPSPTAQSSERECISSNVHGIGVYLTRQERNWLDETEYTSFTMAAIGVLMGAIYEKKFKRPPSIRPAADRDTET